jgi:hypothetical protein
MRRLAATGAVVVGAGLGAAGVASAASGGTTTTTTPATPTTPTTGTACKGPMARGGTPGFAGTALTGTDMASATAAAEAAVPGATVQRAMTGPPGVAYVVIMKRSDGSYVRVNLDAGFQVTSTADGLWAGPPPGPLDPPGAS